MGLIRPSVIYHVRPPLTRRGGWVGDCLTAGFSYGLWIMPIIFAFIVYFRLFSSEAIGNSAYMMETRSAGPEASVLSAFLQYTRRCDQGVPPTGYACEETPGNSYQDLTCVQNGPEMGKICYDSSHIASDLRPHRSHVRGCRRHWSG